MSEEKIIQHAKKAVHAATNKESTWKKKVKEVFLEVLIIVFAVSITLAFHNWNDSAHEKKLAKAFLTGVREDLKQTAAALRKDSADYEATLNYYAVLKAQLLTGKIDAKYVDDSTYDLSNSSFFRFNNARFESFKSSGYLKLIENQDLLNKITNLYVNAFPWLKYAQETVNAEKRADYTRFIGPKMIVDATSKHLSPLLNDPGVRYFIRLYSQLLDEQKRGRAKVLSQIDDTIKVLDKELKE